MKKFNTYKTKWGTGAIIYSDSGLAGLVLPNESHEELELEITEKYGDCEFDKNLGTVLSSTLAKYFDGKTVQFAEQLDYVGATEFETTVYETLRAIPYGETITYAELAALCGRPKAARAVGNAMAKNRVPVVVPCHRVLKSSGGIGGWSCKCGWKERLLEIEGYFDKNSK
jgi:methylated-DNA-[protein]-cysteine S-methyltransferase